MVKSLLRFLAQATLVALAVSSGLAQAANELALYVFDGGAPATGVSVVLDGGEPVALKRDGSLLLDLDGRAHSVQILRGGESLYGFRFDAAPGQLADAVVVLDGSGEHNVEVYSRTETSDDRRSAPTGKVSGVVASGGSGVASASITVQGEKIRLTSDERGRFTFELPRGVYQVTAQRAGGESQTDSVRVVSGVTRSVTIDLPFEGVALPSLPIEEVMVIATFNPGIFEVSERETNQIVDTLDLASLSRFADTDVSASVVRIPGVTVQDSRFVFIRGLGDRYISATLNGATMPSTDPTKRTVPLDLFPSNFVSQLDVKKTFLPSMPGESTGGNLVINTRTFPDERSGQLQIRMTGVSDLTGEDVFVDPTDGGFDWAGWDAGEREAPVAVKAIAQVLSLGVVEDTANGTSFQLPPSTQRELQRLGALLISEDLDLDMKTATPAARIGGNYGDVFYLGDAEIGAFAAFNYENAWEKKDDGVRNTFTPSGDQLDKFVFREYTNTVDLNGLFSVGLNIGDHTFESNTLVSRATESRIVRTVGREGDEFQSQYRNTMDWVERQYISQQFVGSHLLNEDGTLYGEWQFTASQARRDAPDRREVIFSANQGATNPDGLIAGFDFQRLNNEQTGVELNNFFLEPNAIIRRYDELVDANFDLSGALEWDVIESGSTYAQLSAGFQTIYRERDADSDTYGFNINQGLVDQLIAPNVLVSEIIDQETITGDPNTGFAFQNKTLASDSYEAELEYNSVFVTYDHMLDNVWQFVVGMRYEDYLQTTETFSLQGVGEAVESVIDEGSLLPSLGINWFYSEEQQLRLALSRTVARPDFKEAANATFYDTEFDFRVRGNPNLEISDITNADFRWEWYLSEQDSVSAALFYKDMDKPIERVVQPASGTAGNSRTYANAESAELYGIEVEGRKEFPIGESFSRSFFVALNASLIESEVKLSGGDSRKLQGQPDYTFNLVLGYDDVSLGHQLTLLINQNGESIKDVGILGNPDVIEQPRTDVNLVYRYDMNDDFSFRAKLSNLLDDDVEFTQGGQTFLGYKRGVEFQLGLDWNF